MTPKGKRTPTEVRDVRRAAAIKAREAKRLKLAQRELVRRKVEQALPITEAERSILSWQGGNKNKRESENQVIAAAATLVMKPQSVNALRMIVEKTASDMKYNPIRSLIELTADPNVKEAEKIAIHKALLPFLVPQLATPKAVNEHSEGGIKVVITSFSFDGKKPDQALHTEKPTTVDTTATPPT